MKKIYAILIVMTIIWISFISIAITAGASVVIGVGAIFILYLYQNKEEHIYKKVVRDGVEWEDYDKTIKPRDIARKNLYKGLGYDEKISNINDVYKKELNKKKEEGYKKRKDDVPTKEYKKIETDINNAFSDNIIDEF